MRLNKRYKNILIYLLKFGRGNNIGKARNVINFEKFFALHTP
jgi:riboflavin transporter FmnP